MGLEHEDDHSPPSSADITNEWSYISAPPIHLYGVDRQELIFTLYNSRMQVVSYTIDYYKYESRRVPIRKTRNSVMSDVNLTKGYRRCVRDEQPAQHKNW